MEKIEISPGNIVKSLKGHDTGCVYLVIERINADFVLIADGKKKKMSNPKLKRLKHLKFLSEGISKDETIKKLQDSVIVSAIKKFEGGIYA